MSPRNFRVLIGYASSTAFLIASKVNDIAQDGPRAAAVRKVTLRVRV